ncbi:MAG: ATP synthase F1 subunit delta [Bacilli bacterium]|nr:ATP synthase F1 subunit delta [Bacilli bacterium]
MSYVASQYAEALFSMALDENSITQTLDSFQQFTNVIDADMTKFLNHPKITKNDKKKIVETTVTNHLVKHFIFVLIDNHRMDLLSDVLLELHKIIDNQNRVMKVQVFSKAILSEEQQKQLIQNLSKKHNREIELENIVDTTIVGGLRIEYDGMILDDTINNYLHSLQANLMK